MRRPFIAFLTVADWSTQVINKSSEPKQLIHTVQPVKPFRFTWEFIDSCGLCFWQLYLFIYSTNHT